MANQAHTIHGSKCSNGVKLLICTQVVDTRDSDLGFFVRWIQEFAKHCEKVTVVCLRKGEYELPKNVTVRTLGTGRIRRAYTLVRIALAKRRDYDAVFVHMNPEYLVVSGFVWRLLGKRTALWYTHKSVDLKLRIAVLFAETIFTASKESFRLPTKKLHIMGHGIDTDFFTPDPSVIREDVWISFGRLNTSKRHDLAIRAAVDAGKELRIIGEGPEQSRLESLAQQLGARVSFLGGMNQAQVRDELRRASLFLHMSETGSLDKVILEAIACGCPVRTRDQALTYLESVSSSYVSEHHSLQKLIPSILRTISSP